MTLPPLPNLHKIELPTPFSVGDVNVYLLEPARSGEKLTLVDTGPRWDLTRQTLQTALAAYGYSVSDLEQILISHAHPDHCGLAAQLVSESSARLAAHPDSRSALETGTSTMERGTEFYLRWLAECGVPRAVQDRIGLDREKNRGYVEPVRVDNGLADGDRLRMAGREWRVLSTPGHAGGLVCFFEPRSRVLLSSDHLIAKITSNPIVEPPAEGETGRPQRLLQYLEQLERVAALDPAVAYAGHGEPIADVAGLVAERIKFHERRAEQVYQRLAQGPRTVFQLVQEHFRSDLPPVHLFLALSEVQGHLDLLARQKRAEWVASNSACHWQIT